MMSAFNSRLRCAVLSVLVITTARIAAAQTIAPGTLRDKVRSYAAAHDVDMLHELVDFLAIPNLASDQANIRRNADHLVGMLQRRGITTQLLESTTGGPPAVYGELPSPGATRTIVFYAHYDGQPVDTTQWASPPWSVVLRDRPLDAGGKIIPLPTAPGSIEGEWRLYARSASDDKAPIVSMLSAIDALRAAGVKPSVNLKFFFDGEEEAGSPHLHDILTHHLPLLQADAWVFGDGPNHQSRRQQILFGVRGVSQVELTIYGPSHGLHDGHYGNWAPNPVTELANLVASMRNDDGRILIPHFYDDVAPITPAERKALASIPPIDSAMRVEAQLGATEAHDAPLAERIMAPSLNLRGIRGGNVGALASNAIPTEATASIDFRLVPNETPTRIRQLVDAHIRSRGYFIVDHTPTAAERLVHARIAKVTWDAGYPATRVPLDAPVARAMAQAVEDGVGSPVIRVPTMGGSLPMYDFESVLHVPLLVLPIVNHDNNQHSSNENLRLKNLFDGMQAYAGVLARLGGYWTPTR